MSQITRVAKLLLCGISTATWVTQTPVIRDLIAVSTAQMGLVLFGLAIGSLIGILTAGALITRLGARTVIIAGALGIATGLVVIGVGSQAGSLTAVTAGLGILGLGVGAADVAMNVEAARAEVRSGRPFLPLAHGCYSLGTLVGSGLGILAVSLEIPPLWHLLVTAVALAAVLVRAAVVLPPGTGRHPAPSARSAPPAVAPRGRIRASSASASSRSQWRWRRARRTTGCRSSWSMHTGWTRAWGLSCSRCSRQR